MANWLEDAWAGATPQVRNETCPKPVEALCGTFADGGSTPPASTMCLSYSVLEYRIRYLRRYFCLLFIYHCMSFNIIVSHYNASQTRDVLGDVLFLQKNVPTVGEICCQIQR